MWLSKVFSVEQIIFIHLNLTKLKNIMVDLNELYKLYDFVLSLNDLKDQKNG